jgi:hypothetical protein
MEEHKIDKKDDSEPKIPQALRALEIAKAVGSYF